MIEYGTDNYTGSITKYKRKQLNKNDEKTNRKLTTKLTRYGSKIECLRQMPILLSEKLPKIHSFIT